MVSNFGSGSWTHGINGRSNFSRNEAWKKIEGTNSIQQNLRRLGMWFIYDLILNMIMCSEWNLEDYLLHITVVKKSFFSCKLALWENGWLLALISWNPFRIHTGFPLSHVHQNSTLCTPVLSLITADNLVTSNQRDKVCNYTVKLAQELSTYLSKSGISLGWDGCGSPGWSHFRFYYGWWRCHNLDE